MADIDRFSEQAATWDADPEHVDRASSVATIVRRVVPLRDDMHALEIGGGTGLLARALADDLGTVVVTDVAPGMVDAANAVLDDSRYDGWEARRHDIEHDPLPEDRFDLVLGQLALHHMGDVPFVVRRCAELLRPGGWLALIDLDRDPDGAFHASVHDFHGHDGFERETVQRWLTDAGFTDVTTADAGVVTKQVDGVEKEFTMFLATGRLPSHTDSRRMLGTSRREVDRVDQPLQGDQLTLVPVTAVHVPELRRILATPPVRLRWRDEDASPDWPFDDSSATRFAILHESAVCGMVQYGEENEPDYRHASIDIFLDPSVHGRGLGRDAVATLARHLMQDRGHHRLVIDPAADNEAAIRCYTKVGFRPVGTMRKYERDADGVGWHDGLLMDLLVEELDI